MYFIPHNLVSDFFYSLKLGSSLCLCIRSYTGMGKLVSSWTLTSSQPHWDTSERRETGRLQIMWLHLKRDDARDSLCSLRWPGEIRVHHGQPGYVTCVMTPVIPLSLRFTESSRNEERKADLHLCITFRTVSDRPAAPSHLSYLWQTRPANRMFSSVWVGGRASFGWGIYHLQQRSANTHRFPRGSFNLVYGRTSGK